MSDRIVEDALDYFAREYSELLNTTLLKVMALPEQGGLGYRIGHGNMYFDMDGWSVRDDAKRIDLDVRGPLGGEHTPETVAERLKNCLEVHFLETHVSLLARIGWGTGKLILGAVETGVGIVGIVVPEPGTTAGGIALVALGTSTMGEAFSQYAGANQGRGYNILEEGFAAAGSGLADLAGLDRRVGDQVGRGTFLVASIAIGAIGSYKVLHVQGRTAVRAGVGGMPGGFEVGRIQALYPNLRGNGLTIFSIVNNEGKSILRFVFQDGRLYANGRIYGVSNLLRHESDWRKITAGLLRLLWHGAKSGW